MRAPEDEGIPKPACKAGTARRQNLGRCGTSTGIMLTLCPPSASTFNIGMMSSSMAYASDGFEYG